MGSSFYDDHHHDAHGGSHSHSRSRTHGPRHHDHGRFGRWAYASFTAGVGVGLGLYYFGFVTELLGIDLALWLTFVAGYPLVRHAVSDLLRGHFSSHLTIAIAAAAAVAVGEYFAAAEVMFIMLVGEGLEHYAVDRAKGAIAGFVESEPRFARVRRGGREVEIPPRDVRVDDTVVVRAGEKVPVDGRVIAGQSSVDQSMITGEPVPETKGPGDVVFSGGTNEYGVLELCAERVGDDTTLARIRHLIEDAQQRRAPIVRTADRLAKYFLPAVLVAAGLIYLITGEMLRTVAALIVACPCALVLATPAAMAAAIARLAREGVLVKGGDVVEGLARVSAVCFDKTGTLTVGRPTLSRLEPWGGIDSDELLGLAAAAESSSEHLLGRAIVAAAEERDLPLRASEDFQVRAGMGVEARVDGVVVRVGTLALVLESGLDEADAAVVEALLDSGSTDGHTAVAVVAGSRPLGVVALRDPVRADAAEAVRDLRHLGIQRVVMLTGDRESAARLVADHAGISEVHARLLPEEKVQEISTLQRQGLQVLMVGDGINDAPSLATADVGLAIGRGAADISAEAAQVVFIQERLTALADLITYCRRTLRRIRSSILVFAFGINFFAVGLAAVGLLGPAMAAIVHQGASLAVVLSSVRLLFEGTAIEHRSTPLEALRRWIHGLEHAVGRLMAAASTFAGTHRRTILRNTVAILALLWATSGVTSIAPDEVALVQRFGRLTGAALQPGLHLRWPRPIESLTRMRPHRLRVAQIGYRTVASDGVEIDRPPDEATQPAVYEWDTRHAGGVTSEREESLMLTGDENLVEVYAVVHYTVARPDRFRFAIAEPERLVRVTAERVLRWTVASYSLEDVLTLEREAIEARWAWQLGAALARYESGVEVRSVHLTDVHPPLEVVPAFRDVASALEQRSTLANEAEGYLRRQVPLSRGRAEAMRLEAESYSSSRVLHGQGDSARFVELAGAHGAARKVTAIRLYLETLEAVLPGKRKYVARSSTGGRRRFLFYDGDGASRFGLDAPLLDSIDEIDLPPVGEKSTSGDGRSLP